MSAIRCEVCGQFISYDEIERGLVKPYFEPSSHFGPEISEWVHKECDVEEVS